MAVAHLMHFPSVLRSRQDRCSKGERELRGRKTASRQRWSFFVRRPGGRLLELRDESWKRPLIYCTAHCCRRWIAPLSSMCCVALLCARERVMHQGQVWLSVGKIRAAGAHSRGLRRKKRSEKDLEKDRGMIKYLKKKNKWKSLMANQGWVLVTKFDFNTGSWIFFFFCP